MLDKGFAVRAMVHREDSRAEALRAIGAEVVVGDLTHPADVAAAISGAARAYFSMSVSPHYLAATTTFATIAADIGSLDGIGTSARHRKPRSIHAAKAFRVDGLRSRLR